MLQSSVAAVLPGLHVLWLWHSCTVYCVLLELCVRVAVWLVCGFACPCQSYPTAPELCGRVELVGPVLAQLSRIALP
eukprot:COSAG01_NODE_31172_length_602_cov_1.604374_2_plen_76_part_01